MTNTHDPGRSNISKKNIQCELLKQIQKILQESDHVIKGRFSHKIPWVDTAKIINIFYAIVHVHNVEFSSHPPSRTEALEETRLTLDGL